MTGKPKTNENPTEPEAGQEREPEPQYTVTLTAEQVRVLSCAANLYARVLRGQWHHVPEEMLIRLPDSEDVLNLRRLVAAQSDELRIVGKWIQREVHDVLAREPYRRDARLPYELSCVAFDLHEALRHQLWQDEPRRSPVSTHSAKTFKWAASQPLPVIAKSEVK